MPRVKGGLMTKKRHRRILKEASGYFSARSRQIRTAADAVDTAYKYQTRDRRAKKRDFRSLWITRVTAAAKACGTSYSRLIKGLSAQKVALNRKMLSEIAVQDFGAFRKIVEVITK